MSGLEADIERGLESMCEFEPRLEIVAETLRDLAADETVTPLVYKRVCEAVFRLLDLLMEERS